MFMQYLVFCHAPFNVFLQILAFILFKKTQTFLFHISYLYLWKNLKIQNEMKYFISYHIWKLNSEALIHLFNEAKSLIYDF